VRSTYGYQRFCSILKESGSRTGQTTLSELMHNLTCSPGIFFAPGSSANSLLSELEAAGIIQRDGEVIYVHKSRRRQSVPQRCC
jgi:hypothetical protein